MSVEVCPSSSAARATSTPFSGASVTNDWRCVYDTTPLGSGSFARSVACFGHIHMRAQAEVPSARRPDTPKQVGGTRTGVPVFEDLLCGVSAKLSLRKRPRVSVHESAG